ncbi:MAG: inorganic phosphate transporter [Bacilli bacterium]|jgi:PiT family inorganic phosphate transporter|nr:inorganic phosphate transporter [Bacilli bacterium]
MSISEFFSLCGAHPWAIVAIAMNAIVIFINGWTDGPNAIATCVTTRAMRPKTAVAMAAVCNLIGVLCIGFLASHLSFGDVAQTIANLIEWPQGVSIDQVMVAISSGLFAIVVWSLGSTYYGFPSSESNELVGGIIGSGMALTLLSGEGNAFAHIGWKSFFLVVGGFFGSLILGFLLGYGVTKLIESVCRKMTRGETTRFFTKGQIVSGGVMSFVHGVQDGAKFIGVFVMIVAMLSTATDVSLNASSLSGVWWMYVPVAVLMGAGTCMGGYSIIKTLGGEMAKLQKYQAFATDVAATIGLLLATFLAIPVSTGTVKSTAILGGGATKSLKRIHWDVAGKMIGSWIAIFPLTALIGFVFVMIFVWTC